MKMIEIHIDPQAW